METTMLIVVLMVAGFTSEYDTGDSCIDALDQLRGEGRMEILATEVLEDNVLAFTLGDVSEGRSRRRHRHSHRWQSSSTAIIVCERATDDLVDDPDDELDDPIEDDLLDDES